MAERKRFTVVSTSSRYDFDFEREMLTRAKDLEIELRAAVCNSEDDIIAAGRDADAMLASTREAFTRRVIERLPRCKVIARYGVGLDNVDLDAATDSDIVVTHFPGYCTAEVADHAFAFLLALNRRLVEVDRDLRQGAWSAHGPMTREILRGPIPPLREQTLGLIGFGRIGKTVARRAAGFDLTILAADPYLDPGEMTALGVESVTLDDLLARADYVSIHCPLTPETRCLIDAAAIARMKPGAVLINTARGPIVDLDAATAALQSGALAGAALDVFSPEPLPVDSPLYGLPNVILTPHAAYYSERSVEIVRRETLEGALAVLRNERPRVVANPSVLERVHLTTPGSDATEARSA